MCVQPPRTAVLFGLERRCILGKRRSMAARPISTSSCTSSGVKAPTVTISHGRRVAKEKVMPT